MRTQRFGCFALLCSRGANGMAAFMAKFVREANLNVQQSEAVPSDKVMSWNVLT